MITFHHQWNKKNVNKSEEWKPYCVLRLLGNQSSFLHCLSGCLDCLAVYLYCFTGCLKVCLHCKLLLWVSRLLSRCSDYPSGCLYSQVNWKQQGPWFRESGVFRWSNFGISRIIKKRHQQSWLWGVSKNIMRFSPSPRPFTILLAFLPLAPTVFFITRDLLL